VQISGTGSVFLAVSIAGIVGASWVWVVIGAMTLFVLGFSRWRGTIAKACSLDIVERTFDAVILTDAPSGGALIKPHVLEPPLTHDLLPRGATHAKIIAQRRAELTRAHAEFVSHAARQGRAPLVQNSWVNRPIRVR
jgi:hypothetical protein